MKSAKMMAAAAALLAVAGMSGLAHAQQSTAPQDQADGWNGAYPMGPRMMGPDGMMGYRGMGPSMMGWRGQGAYMCAAMSGHIEGRLAYLKAELKIAEAQTTLWNAYAAAARENAKAMTARCTTMMKPRESAAPSLPDRLDQHEQFMAAQLDAMRAMNKALKPLYAALSDGQKKTADQLFWGPMGMM